MDLVGNLNICTWNCNGFYAKSKHFELQQFVLQHNIHIVLLQETHLNNLNNAKYMENILRCKAFWNFGSYNSRGTAVLFFIDVHVEQFQFDLDGRLMFVDFIYNNSSYRLVNIYAPNNETERKTFFQELIPFLVCNRSIICAGDFNCIVQSKYDKIGGNENRGFVGSDILCNIMSDFKLLDVYRYLYPSVVSTTWHSKTISCRLDRFYVSHQIKNSIIECITYPSGSSDHDFVVLTVKVSDDIQRGKSYWKMNNSILRDEEFHKSFVSFFQILTEDVDISSEVWDVFKIDIKNFIISYCMKKQKRNRNNLKCLEKKYHNLQHLENKFPNQYIDQITSIKKQILELNNDNSNGVKIRSKANVIDFSEKPSKYFFKLESDRAFKKLISQIDVDSFSYKKTTDILQAFQEFYHDLFSEEEIDETLSNFFIENLPILDSADVATCEGEITKDEILTALKQMENNKSPGSDGLTKEFYLTFYNVISDVLVKVYNDVYEEGLLSSSQRLSYITLLCKDRNHSTLMKNYRPISLLNVDYKIISKIMTNRIGKVISILVHPDQTCAIKNRSIFDNAHLLRNVVDYVEQKNLKCCFVSLDQEKAFDRVNYDFMFKVLSAYNFGPSLLRWINILYNDISSCVLVNGFISDQFSVTRGVRQGCSLSPLLYVLILEPFARKIREDSTIEGIKLPGQSDFAKLSLYADDSTGILSSELSIKKLLHYCHLYGKASGAKLNKMKTKGIWLGKWKSRSDHPFGISWIDKIKIVGIMFGDVSPDDVWQPIFSKFEKTLRVWKGRKLSLIQKVMVVNVLACSKLWYVGTVVEMPNHYLKLFQKTVFSFLWSSKSEPLARSTVYQSHLDGGLSIVNIFVKLQSLYLQHIQKIILNSDAKWCSFAIYWIGFTLRGHNSFLGRNSIPHSDYVPCFYRKCKSVFQSFVQHFPDIKWGDVRMSTKFFYINLLKQYLSLPKIESAYPTFNFRIIFQHVFHPVIDPFSRDIVFKIVHEILPVNYRMHRFHIYKSNECTLCDSIETISHLFFECPFIQPLVKLVNSWINVISNKTVMPIQSHWRFYTFPKLEKNALALFLYLISESLSAIWYIRCIKKFDKKSPSPHSLICCFLNKVKLRIQADFFRMSSPQFLEFWCSTDLFCEIIGDQSLLIHINI